MNNHSRKEDTEDYGIAIGARRRRLRFALAFVHASETSLRRRATLFCKTSSFHIFSRIDDEAFRFNALAFHFAKITSAMK